MKTKLILAVVSLSLFVMYSCKKEKPKLEPSLGTTTTSGGGSGPKIYTYKTAYIDQVKFYALSNSTYNGDYIRFQVAQGPATLDQSPSSTYNGSLPFLVDNYAPSTYISSFTNQHTLYFDHRITTSATYYNFYSWNFIPQSFVPNPSTLYEKDTTIQISNANSTLIIDVTIKFQGI